MSQPQGLLLPHVSHVDHVGDAAHDGQQVLSCRGLRAALQLEADVEVILDGALAAAGDDDDVLDSGVDGLLDAVLNDRLIDDRQHLLGLGLGGGEEAGSQPGGGENGFANFGIHHITVCFVRLGIATGN